VKVLIAEDNKVERTVVERLLEKHGYPVISTASGEEAVEAFKKNYIQVALLDWMLPGMDGVEVCKAIREHEGETGDHCYVIMVTSKSQITDIVQAMDAGADDFITKPVSEEELLLRIKVGEEARAIELKQSGEKTQTVVEEAGPALVVNDLTREAEGEGHALKHLSFSVARGEVYALLGNENCGRTELMRLLEGGTVPDTGTIEVLGRDISKLREEMRKKVGIIRMGKEAELVLMDDPTLGLDPASRRSIWKMIRDLKHRGKTVVLATGSVEEARQVADNVAIIEEGRLVASGKSEEVLIDCRGKVRVMIEGVDDGSIEGLVGGPGVDVAREGDGVVISLLTRDQVQELEEMLASNDVDYSEMRIMAPTLENIRACREEDAEEIERLQLDTDEKEE